eukprot:1036479-Rhodomonas_salina.1
MTGIVDQLAQCLLPEAGRACEKLRKRGLFKPLNTARLEKLKRKLQQKRMKEEEDEEEERMKEEEDEDSSSKRMKKRRGAYEFFDMNSL